jgi:hypothetical protein
LFSKNLKFDDAQTDADATRDGRTHERRTLTHARKRFPRLPTMVSSSAEVVFLELGAPEDYRANDAAFKSMWTRDGGDGVDVALSDGDVIVIASGCDDEAIGDDVVAGGRSMDDADARGPKPRLTVARVPSAGGADGSMRYALCALDDDFGATYYGAYASVHGEAPVLRFESKAITREAQWEVASAKTTMSGGEKIVLRSCVRRDVTLTGTLTRSRSAWSAFNAWATFVKTCEIEGRLMTEVKTEADAILGKLADGFMRELKAIENEAQATSRAKFGPRVIAEEIEREIESSTTTTINRNPFEESPSAPSYAASELDPLSSLKKRSTTVNPSTPAGGIASLKNRALAMDAYPSPTDEEIAAVRDESWRFTSTGKKSSASRRVNPFEESPIATADTPGRMTDYWDFSAEDESFYDAIEASPAPASASSARVVATSKTTADTLAGKYGQIEDEDFEHAAVRKSGLDPRAVVSTPGTTSAMLKYVGQMYVSEFRSEMNILNVPFVTLDEVVVDFVELARAKGMKPAKDDPRLDVKGAITEQYIMSMKTDDFLLMLHDFGDEAGYAEIATLKRALAIAITTKGALSSSDSDSDF